MAKESIDQHIRTLPQPGCYVCGAQGELLHSDMRDRLFGAPGVWQLKRCPIHKCGLVWLDPMPDPQELARLYQNYLSHDRPAPKSGFIHRLSKRASGGFLRCWGGYKTATNDRLGIALGYLLYLHPALRAGAEALVMNLQGRSTGRLLEIGFGSGEGLYRLHCLGWKVEGIELDPIAVKKARHRGLNVKLGDLTNQRYPAENFDAIVFSHVIEHVHDPLTLLRECHRLLATGGQLVIYTPNSNSWGHRLFKDNWRGLEPPRHLRIFTPSSLAALVGRAGFSDTDTSVTDRAAGYACESQMLKTGAWPEAYPLSLKTKAICGLSPFYSWMVSIFWPNAGSEIVLIAKK